MTKILTKTFAMNGTCFGKGEYTTCFTYTINRKQLKQLKVLMH